MLTVASLLAAMTIAGAFWVGVLAARRLRDWGEGRRALESPDQPLALAAASTAIPDDERSRRVREAVARRLGSHHRTLLQSRDLVRSAELGLATLRIGDVIVVDSADAEVDGDFIVEGLVHLREGTSQSVVAIMNDGSRKRWLVGDLESEHWMSVVPVSGHGIVGEPPRQIQRGEVLYTLQRRGQASTAVIGRSGRGEGTRAAIYVYSASARDVLWLERWGNEVLLGEGRSLPAHHVTFLPGS